MRSTYAGVGTRLRHVLELLDGDVAEVYAERGLDYRPRFSPVMRALVAEGPMSIGGLAAAVGVTHSAASQTVTQMARSGYVDLRPGRDARTRVVHPTAKATALLPLIEAEWDATETAMAALDAELPYALSELLRRTEEALRRRGFRERIGEVAPAEEGDEEA